MSGRVYVVQADNTLQSMAEEPFSSEDMLQRFLKTYPDLLAGDQMNPIAPRQWLLISRELPVPDSESSGGRWAVDHLFIDQDGIPTLVEVKRSTDTRIRREVVGQMLDYAVNAAVFWSIDQIKAGFEETVRSRGREPAEVLLVFLDALPDRDPEAFWHTVHTNLRAGRLRLVFVADVIPIEVRRIVEFLNEQMADVEVLAVEIRQFVGQGVRALVPTVLGVTAKPGAGAMSVAGRRWDRASFLSVLEQYHPELAPIAGRLLDWIAPLVSFIAWGRGKVYPQWSPTLMLDDGRRCALFYCWAAPNSATIQIPFGTLKDRPPFTDPAKREELRRRLNQIDQVDIPEDGTERYPTFPLAALSTAKAFTEFQTRAIQSRRDGTLLSYRRTSRPRRWRRAKP
ncbi:PDDEXK family nuclease [Caldinitratiruptor microaerophilus]|uniref:DUF4268 domain-containing protein n=1 Tax=Caldinitratiruptor microaerophilus TaxID=671077 RepID=A0AA35CJI3_9FIRM|nr:hypothetical protein [Caldinitratiruptor microaerophilus]BDG59503.1 hypothetical protein caldi_05930 [Caldinitratiruptor microaerophilus]